MQLTQVLLLATLITELVFTRRKYSAKSSEAHEIRMISAAIFASLATSTTIACRAASTARGPYHLTAAALFYARLTGSPGRPDKLFILVPAVLFLAFLVDLQTPFTRKTVDFPFPELSLFQRLTFNWLQPLFNLAGKKQLSKDDLWHVHEPLSVQSSLHDLLRTALMDRTKPHSFLWLELRAYKGTLLFSGALELVGVLCRLVQPWLLKEFLRSPSLDVVGYMLLTRLLAALCTNLSLYSVKVMGAKLKSSLTALLYEMTLALPTSTRS